MVSGTYLSATPGVIPIGEVIRIELSAVQKTRADLMTPRPQWGIHALTLVACILINSIYFLTRNDYFALFIAASFYVNMYYFIPLILPRNFEQVPAPPTDRLRLKEWLKEIGITRGLSQFHRLTTNSLFMNSQAQSLGLGIIFTVDIFFTLIQYFGNVLPVRTVVIVISQCAIIIIFYFLVWKVEPFSTTYMQKVEGVKRRLRLHNLPESLVAAMFMFGFILAIIIFLITIIYLPGVTLKNFLNYSDLTEIGHLFGLLAILGLSQYFIIRYIHGVTSRTMAERLFDFKENTLTELLDTTNTLVSETTGPVADPLELTKILLESEIFIVKRNTIFGFFPVFVIDLDISVLMDTTKQTALRGYIADTKR